MGCIQCIQNNMCSKSVLKFAVQGKIVIVRLKVTLVTVWSGSILRSHFTANTGSTGLFHIKNLEESLSFLST